MAINLNKGYIYSNAQYTEYILACIENATPEQKALVTSKWLNKKRQPATIISGLNSDEKGLLLGELGICEVRIFTTSEKMDNIAAFSKAAKLQLQRQKQDINDETAKDGLDGNYYGKRKIFIVTTTQFLKYYHLIAEYQNSRKYLFNRDFKELIRSTKYKKKIKELEEDSQDIRSFIKLYNAQRRGHRYVESMLKLNAPQEEILMLLAERYDKKMLFSEIEKTLDHFNESKLRIAVQIMLKKKLVYDFGQGESRGYLLSVNGWNLVRNILDKTMMDIHK